MQSSPTDSAAHQHLRPPGARLSHSPEPHKLETKQVDGKPKRANDSAGANDAAGYMPGLQGLAGLTFLVSSFLETTSAGCIGADLTNVYVLDSQVQPVKNEGHIFPLTDILKFLGQFGP